MQVRDNSAFDLWLHESLSATFDAVLQEPPPDNLLAIIIGGAPETPAT